MKKFLCKLYILNDITIYTFVILGTIVRIYFAMLPISNDEAYTFLHYVKNNFSEVFNYTLPNNHVLMSLLAYFSTRIFVQDEFFLRLPSIFFGSISIVTIAIATKIIFEDILDSEDLWDTRIIASFLFSMWPYLIMYAAMARGYTIMNFLTILATAALFRFIKTPNLRYLILMGLILALSMVTIPTTIYVIAPIYITLLILFLTKNYKIQLQHIIAFPAICILFTLLFYVPVILNTKSVASIVDNRFVTRETNSTLKKQLKVFKRVYDFYTRDIPLSIVLVLITAFVYSILWLIKYKKSPQAIFISTWIICAPAISYIKGNIPPPRVYIYMLPIIIIFISIGLVKLIELAGIKKWLQTKYICLITGIIFALYLMHTNKIGNYTDVGYFADAKIASQIILTAADMDDSIKSKPPVTGILKYYEWKYNFAEELKKPDGIDNSIYIIYKPHHTEKIFKEDLNNLTVLFESDKTIILQK